MLYISFKRIHVFILMSSTLLSYDIPFFFLNLLSGDTQSVRRKMEDDKERLPLNVSDLNAPRAKGSYGSKERSQMQRVAFHQSHSCVIKC